MWLALLLACPAPPSPVEAPADPTPPTPISAEVPAEVVPAPIPAPPPPEIAPAPLPERLAARHVLITWKGAPGAPPHATRDPATAEAFARSLLEQHAAGTPLETLARAHSDDPSGPRGGELGVFLTGTFVPEFEAAIAALEIGAVGLVQTPFGWHLVQREPIARVGLNHLFVAHRDGWRATTTRSPEEARARAEAARGRVAAGEPFAAVAAEISEEHDRDLGGKYGHFGPGQLIPALDAAAFALPAGGLSDVIESPYGFHVLQRTD